MISTDGYLWKVEILDGMISHKEQNFFSNQEIVLKEYT